MADQTPTVRVEEIDWFTVLPFVRLFGAFRIAMGPSKLLTAMTLVISLCVLGHAIDALGRWRAFDGEIDRYANLSTQDYDRWLDSQRHDAQPQIGVYATIQQFKTDAFTRLIDAATQLDFGFGQVLHQTNDNRHTVIGSLRDLVTVLPSWLWHSHRGFLLTYGPAALAVCAILAAALARMTALHATREQRTSMLAAVRYAIARWVWFFLTPVLPLMLAGLMILAVAGFGAVFFNLPVLNVLGGLTFVVPLTCGAIATAVLVLLVAAGPLLYPAIAIEGTDGFDAISRAFGYVLGRPWRWLLFNLIMLVYGAMTYLLLGLVIDLILTVIHGCVGWWVIRDVSPGLNRLDAIFPAPQGHHVAEGVPWSQLGIWDKVTAGMIGSWVYLTRSLLGAYAISFYMTANTWIYLLLRRGTDGTELDDVFLETGHHEPDSAQAMTDGV